MSNCEGALAAAAVPGDWPLGTSTSVCLAVRASRLLCAGADRASTIQYAEDALKDASCRASLPCVLRALTALVCAGELVAADEHCLRLAGPGPHGSADVIAVVRARMARLSGDLDGARHLLHSALRADVPSALRRLAAPRLAELLTVTGEVSEAKAVLVRGGLADLIVRAHPARPMWLAARAAVRVADGRFSSGVDDYLAAGQEFTERDMVNPAVLPWQGAAALGAHSAGRTELATRLAEQQRVAALRWGAPRDVGLALYVCALVGNDLGMLGESISLLELAGARAELAMATQERDRRAESSPRRQPLTAQETTIAKLAQTGYTNKQIAAKLFLTVRGVEFHLSNSYRKLGVSGRRELRSAGVLLD